MRVLLIEGEEDVAGAVLRGLARAGLNATWASRGRMGLALRDSVRPHVVLVDPALPDMDGPSLIALLTRPRNCGVVVFSGMAEEVARAMGGDHRADDVIAKPSNMQEIVARVRAVHLRVNADGEQGRATSSGFLEAEPQ